ncbi:MAG: glycosyltransferase family 1 protein [Caldilinea sp. CFX5]|nr:glycosyltransferase family 1 protein [Caldilinea sp. CFX5]
MIKKQWSQYVDPKKLARRLRKLLCQPAPQSEKLPELKYPITLYPTEGLVHGRVLFSYLPDSILWSEDDPRLNGHSNLWESREIAYIFSRMGYIVDAIRLDDYTFIPIHQYDIVFDIFINLQRLVPLLEQNTLKILHCTGSDAYYQNHAEMARVAALEERRNTWYAPKRMNPYPELARKSLQIADSCSLIGNSHTWSTYPETFRDKMTLVTVTASNLESNIKCKSDLVPKKREFLWFFGGGLVHKGLDLVIEVFARNQDLVLNIVGPVRGESDFFKIYEYELTKLANIKCHHYLKPNSEEFKKIIKHTFCFVAPSCSESISTAVVTCLQVGLYPIVSRDTGVTLPKGCGTYLQKCAIDEIEEAVWATYQMNENTLTDQIYTTQQYALHQFSRENFQKNMQGFIETSIQNKRCK